MQFYSKQPFSFPLSLSQNRHQRRNSWFLWFVGFELILKPETPAFVKKGQTLKLTCQSKESGGIFGFFTFGVEGRRVTLGVGVWNFKECVSNNFWMWFWGNLDDQINFAKPHTKPDNWMQQSLQPNIAEHQHYNICTR